VLPGPLPRDGGIVHPLVVQLIVGDRVVLDTSVRPVAVRVDVRADVIGGQVESDVAVEVAVVSVAGVALARAPDLLRRLGVPREGRHARAAMDGRIAAVDGGAVDQHDAVGIDEEVPDRRLPQQLVDARHVTALREPHAARATPEVPLVQVGRYVNLGAQGRPVAIEKWKERVGGSGGDDLHPTRLLEAPERADQVPLVGAPGVANRLEAIPVHLGQTMVVRLGPGALELLLGQLDQAIEVARVALLQEVVGEHRDERGRERDGATVGDAVGDKALAHQSVARAGRDWQGVGRADGPRWSWVPAPAGCRWSRCGLTRLGHARRRACVSIGKGTCTSGVSMSHPR
jgi:hypothetical protein